MARTRVFNNTSEESKINELKGNVRALTIWGVNYASIIEKYGYDENLVRLITNLSDFHEVQNNASLFEFCVMCFNSANKYGSKNLYKSFEWFFSNFVNLIKE